MSALWTPGLCEERMSRNDEGQARQQSERDRQLIALRLVSPKRANAGRVIPTQADAGGCPLFVAADEPSLFLTATLAVWVRSGPR